MSPQYNIIFLPYKYIPTFTIITKSLTRGVCYNSTIHSLLISIPCIRLVSLKFNLWLLVVVASTAFQLNLKPIALIIRLAVSINYYTSSSLHDRRDTTKQLKRIRLDSNPKGMRLFERNVDGTKAQQR